MTTSSWNKNVSRIARPFRTKRGAVLRAHFPALAQMRIIDVGGSRHFWEESGLSVPPENVTIYNVGAGDTHATTHGAFADARVKTYDGHRIPEPVHSFDLAICNSVVEHVVPFERTQLVSELHRVAKHVYVQTPAKSFPIEPHFLIPFLQWLPRPIGFALAHISPWRILSRPSKATIHGYFFGTRLLSTRDVKALLPKSTLYRERLLGLTKSYVAIE